MSKNAKFVGICLYDDDIYSDFAQNYYSFLFKTAEGRDPDEDELIEYASKEKQINYLDLITDILRIEKETGPHTYVVLARLGLWNGTFDGGRIIQRLDEVIRQCMEDENEISVSTRGLLTIESIHHDGANFFQIKELTKEGERYVELHGDEMTDRELHHKLFNDSHLSRHCTVIKKYLKG